MAPSISKILATGFGSGKVAFAPGTAGTIVAIPIVLLLNQLHLWWYLLFVIGGFILGVKICDKVAKEYQEQDPAKIVWDEIIGFSVSMLLIPLSLWSILIAFVLFRFFDIVKPLPISYLERKLTGGFGIMADDLLAGIFTWGCLQLIMLTGWYF